jgi:tetratricopeptide (TPR) repeat protein
VVTLLTGRDHEVPEPPRPTVRVTEDGVRLARFDLDRLAAWCRDAGLPDPPGVPEAALEVAEGLLESLQEAAAGQSAEAYGRVGQIAEGLDSHAAALAYFRVAAEKNPSDFRWPYYIGCVHQETGRRNDAIAAFERALELSGTYPTTAARLGQLYLDAGRDDEAKHQFERYAAARPDDWFGLVGLARLALRDGDPDRALALLGRAAQLGPDDFQVNYQLGRTHTALGDREEAQRYFDRAEQAPQGGWFRMRDPLVEAMHGAASSVDALKVEFERKSGSGDWAELAALAEEIVRRRSGDVRMRGNLAGLYRKLGRFDDAHAELDRALAYGVDDIRLHNLRAELHLAQNEFEPAIAATDRVLALSATDSRAQSVRGRALTMLGRYAEAEEWMRKSLATDPGNLSNRVVLAEILVAQERPDEAATVFREILGAEPLHEYSRRRLQEIAAPR